MLNNINGFKWGFTIGSLIASLIFILAYAK